jgi:hypothetical protein
MTPAVPGTIRRDARPPIEMEAAPAAGTAGASIRATAVPRPWVSPRLCASTALCSHAPDDPLVRRFWTALIGPGAVADLLRLTTAAHNGGRLRRPTHLQILLAEGLAHRVGDTIVVPVRVPALSESHQRRLHPTLRAEYRSAIRA